MAQRTNGGGVLEGSTLELVVAVAENDVIGRANALPWRLSADLRRFKLLTLGKSILMGRKTYESIGKALPGRTNIVLTGSREFHPGDCVVTHSLEEARRGVAHESVLMVIGGAEVYRQCLPLARRIHLTRVHTRVADGDTLFPAWAPGDWSEVSRESHAADEKNEFAYSFVTLDRVRWD
jgi:dihydrofolate reductase